jgi:hypothetical protein
MRRLALLPLVLALACRIEHSSSGRPPGTPSDADSLPGVEQDSTLRADVEATLREYYRRLGARDWRALRASFWPGGTVTTRGIPPGEHAERVWVQTVDEFARRASDGPGKMAVFSERMIGARVAGYGDLADAWVVYEGRSGRTRDSVKTVRGIDAFHLYRNSGEWRIVSLAFTRAAKAARRSAP